jgi:hypothetical protein
MKPKHGFSKEIYTIVKANGPLAYSGIHARLRQRSVRMSKDQVLKTLSNMVQRNQLVRSEHNPKKFVVVDYKDHKDVIVSDPIPTPPAVEKTPEIAELPPSEGLTQLDSTAIIMIASIAAGTAALTTIVLRFV